MLRSYVSFASRGEVVLRREIVSQLGVGPNGVLYGALFPAETGLVLSQIPPHFWKRALKIIVHTHHRPGSLAAVAGAIAALDLDTISSWASTESFQSHLCSTSIVVPSNIDKKFTCEDIVQTLSTRVTSHLSDLPIFMNGRLRAIRVTPLAILGAYFLEMEHSDYHRIEISHHSLRLGDSQPISKPRTSSLWEQLLTASDIPTASACILTPDTEEAFLRISAVPESARLTRIVLKLRIDGAKSSSFAGYWTNALDELKEHNHSIFVAHNLLVAKKDSPPSEEAEFHFVTDRRLSLDKGLPLAELGPVWEKRLVDRLQKLADKRESTIKGQARVTRPRGVGVPCFFASSAKPIADTWAETALWLCRTLEGHGFKPVNVDVASGADGLRDQVLELIRGCRFMVVLHCPGEKRDPETGMFEPSDWVQFEEAAMARQGDEVIRLRVSNVRNSAYAQGFIERIIPESGMKDSHKDDFVERLERWVALMSELRSDNVYAADTPTKFLQRDLVVYYGGREKRVGLTGRQDQCPERKFPQVGDEDASGQASTIPDDGQSGPRL